MKSNTFYLFLKKPLVAGIISFVLLLLITQYLAYQNYLLNENKKQNEINNEVNLIKEKLQSIVQYSYSATKTLQYIVERNGIPKDFDSIAHDLLRGHKYFDVVQLVDGEGFITHVYPLEGNEVLGFNILTSSTSISGAQETIKREEFFIAGPVNLKQGGVGMISRQPIFIDNKFSGFSAVITQLSNFLNDLNIDVSNDNRFMYQLSKINLETGEEQFFLEQDMLSFKQFAVPIKMPYGEWKLYVIPTKNQALISTVWVSLFGLMLAGLGGLAVWFFAGRPMRLNKIINDKLIEQEAQLKLIHETSREQIKKSESNLKRAQQTAKIGSWELDKVTNKMTCSNEMYRIFEINPEEHDISKNILRDAIHPDDKTITIKKLTSLEQKSRPYIINYRLIFDDEHIKYVEEQCEVIYDENKNPKKTYGTIQDISERKKIEQELKNSELLYRSLTSNAPVLIFNANEAGECTYVNVEWIKYTGMSFEDAMGYGWQKALHPEDKERVLNEWQTAVLTNTDFISEFRFTNKSGKITYLSAKAMKLVDTNNNTQGLIGIASDITERINQEKELLVYKNNLEKLVNLKTQELQESREALLNLLEDLNLQSTELEKEKVKAQSADLMKSAFLATMSHELRTPMNSIIGFTGILLKEYAGPLNEEQKKQLSMVKKSSQHLLGLINDVLDISKIEAGKLNVSFYPFNYITTLEKTAEFLMAQATKKGLFINTEISSLEIIIESDERRVEQVLLNLLSNAIKFSNKGTILVKVDIIDKWLITQIIDQGIGISKKDLNKLFMPFIQLEGGLNRSHEGTGLGLAICKSLIEKLGGTIQVKSKKGEGSNFTFKLPIKQE